MNLLIQILIALALMSSTMSEETLTIADFKKNYFKIISANKGFYEVKAGFENIKDEIVIGNGFVNKALYVDIITVKTDRSIGYFYIFDVENNEFKMAMQTPKLGDGQQIMSIKLTQIRNVGGLPDVVMVTSESLKTGGIRTMLKGFSIKPVNPEAFQYKLDEISTYSYVNDDTVANDLQEPFSYQLFEGNKAVTYFLFFKDGQRTLAYYNTDKAKFEEKSFAQVFGEKCDNCQSVDTTSKRRLPPVFTSAFIDINRDCRSDIILESVDENGQRWLEFYYYMNGGFGFIKELPISETYSIGVVEDINENNNPDILFFDSSTKQLLIFLNNINTKGQKEDFYCFENVKTDFPYPSLADPNNTDYRLVQDLVVGADLSDYSADRMFNILRLGDFNLDSYKDLMVNLTVDGKDEVYLFLNVPCEKQHAQDLGVDNTICRYFDSTKIEEDDISIIKNKNAVQSSFFDFGERG